MLTTDQARRAWSPPCSGRKARVTLHGGAVVSVDPRIVVALTALSQCLQSFRYGATPPDCGAYNCRPITGGTKYSLHAYGIAVDINWQQNPYGKRLVTNMPMAMIAAIESIRTVGGLQVWRWGGRYAGNKDAMHFEVVVTPAQLARGLNLKSLAVVGTPVAFHKGWIEPGSPASEIRLVEALINEGRAEHQPGKKLIAVNGLYDNETKAAVAEFQRDWNDDFKPKVRLAVTGAVDPETMKALIFVHSALAA